jgi:hypothetical protein
MSHPQEDGIAHWLAARALGFVLAAALCSPAFAQQQAQQRLTLNFVNTEIEAVARAMADFTGRTKELADIRRQFYSTREFMNQWEEINLVLTGGATALRLIASLSAPTRGTSTLSGTVAFGCSTFVMMTTPPSRLPTPQRYEP